MADKLLYIPNDETQNFLFCRLQLNELTNKNLIKVLKVVKQMNVNVIIKLCLLV